MSQKKFLWDSTGETTCDSVIRNLVQFRRIAPFSMSMQQLQCLWLVLALLCNSSFGSKTVIIGSGFGGLGCVKTLCESGVKDVVLLDAMDYTQPFRTPSNKPLDIGVKGFWYDYPNIYSLVDNFLNLDQDDIFTKCTNSSFYSINGLEATAPVFGDSLPLPSPLGQIFASAKLFTRLPLIDRASMVGLLYAILDYNRDEKTLEAYDRMNGHDLFVKFGLSKRLVEDFLKPTLLVGLFKPPGITHLFTLAIIALPKFTHKRSCPQQ